MKFLIIDDEHCLYRTMFKDALQDSRLEEIPKFKTKNKIFDFIRKIYFSEKINRHINLPKGGIWDIFYYLYYYPYNPKEEYIILVLNGTLRNYFSESILKKVKNKYNNVKLVLLMYDSMSSKNIHRYKRKMSLFDEIFTFDIEDAKKYKMHYMNQTFSVPTNVYLDNNIHSDAFFIGYAGERLNLLHRCYEVLSKELNNIDFRLIGVDKKNQKYEKIKYNNPLPYEKTLQLEYNSDCIIEIVKKGQTGPTLRTCEAICFGKKLLTNNIKLREYEFYNPEYIQIFEKPEDIDMKFFKKKIYSNEKHYNEFSPILLLDKIEKIMNGETYENKN